MLIICSIFHLYHNLNFPLHIPSLQSVNIFKEVCFTFLHGGDVADDGNGLGGGEGRGGRHSSRTRERKLSLHCPTIKKMILLTKPYSRKIPGHLR